jgi:hypothetical protein
LDNNDMSTTAIRLVLGDVEAEVVAEALDLYLRTRPPEADRRFEYRYRAARTVMDNLAQNREVPPDNTRDNTPGDDETVVSARLWDRRNYERLED